jgi:hypothetical protein
MARPDPAEVVLGRYRLGTRAELVGLDDSSPRAAGGGPPTAHQVVSLAERLARRGVGVAAASSLSRHPADLAALTQLLDAVEQSPQPDSTWAPMRALLGDDLLADLLDISPSSLMRYANLSRTAPDEVAARLHALAMACADLRGAYNELGIRRWFVRPRPSLEGGSVRDHLGRNWDPDSPAGQWMRALAASVLSIGAT